MPLFRFVRRADGEEKHLDIGSLPLPPEKQQYLAGNMTLRSSEAPWHDRPPEADDALILHDLTEGFWAGCPIPLFELAAYARHGARCPRKK